MGGAKQLKSVSRQSSQGWRAPSVGTPMLTCACLRKNVHLGISHYKRSRSFCRVSKWRSIRRKLLPREKCSVGVTCAVNNYAQTNIRLLKRRSYAWGCGGKPVKTSFNNASIEMRPVDLEASYNHSSIFLANNVAVKRFFAKSRKSC